MSDEDEKENPEHPDRQRIDLHDPHELLNCAESLGVTPDELQAAVQQVGPLAHKVREYLKLV